MEQELKNNGTVATDGTRSGRNTFNVMEATMACDPDASEWATLKGYFAVLADHDPAQECQPIEAIFDDQIRRRFGEWIARTARVMNKPRGEA